MLVNSENILARMEMQESAYEHDPESAVEPSWEVAKDILEDEAEK